MLAKESERCQALSVNSTTDPRSVSAETKQAKACWFKNLSLLQQASFP